ncbi:pyochelin biosynthetic protein PchC [Streptomyces capoamus]|uniref:Pyochelin biosynthetic protein PchC n=1 Tax=Streptomyces capoamus TaxID=68183 RepID=A0A919KFW3_9ACTN|nr:alpha/beta fold hydrolase [Streptomyces capoamus]GGW13175.1 pyochelin biosynthetic protein PchC [Streptomyces libani subsp. rufus]GHG74572.1 pyochelin biosynthetic protein PchC [Streptomyces capoamus]
MAVSGPSPSLWFRLHPSPGPVRLRLVCLPHAGGAATFFQTWERTLGAGVEVLATRYPGRQERIAEPCLTSLEALADAVAEELTDFLDGPVALFGHSMGASVAYEVTLRLESSHPGAVAGLFVSAREAPHLVTPRTVHLLDDEGVLEEVRRLGGFGAALLEDPSLREILLPPLRADFRIAGTYRATEPVPVRCPLAAYAGEEDTGAAPDAVRRWSEVSAGPFDLTVMPGGHFYLISERDATLTDISRRLGQLMVAAS